MLEKITKRHNKYLPKFLTRWARQVHQEHEKKPFHRNLIKYDEQKIKQNLL